MHIHKSGNGNNATCSSDNDEDDYHCKYCSNLFHEPILLHCGHSVCKRCAIELFSLQQLKRCLKLSNRAKQTDMLDKGEDTKVDDSPTVSIICPVCSKQTLVDKNLGVGMLKQNFDLRDAIQHLSQKKCGNECGRDATIGCKECQTLFCDECRALAHKMPFMRNHISIPLEQLEQNQARTCPTHNIESNVFCITCGSLACLMCYSFGDHKLHECLPLHEYVAKCKQEIQDMSSSIDHISVRASSAIEEVKQEIESIDQVREQNNLVINGEFDNLLEKVNERRIQLVALNQSIYEAKK